MYKCLECVCFACILVNYLNLLTVYSEKKKGRCLFLKKSLSPTFVLCVVSPSLLKVHIFSLFSALVPHVGFELEFSPLDKMVHF